MGGFAVRILYGVDASRLMYQRFHALFATCGCPHVLDTSWTRPGHVLGHVQDEGTKTSFMLTFQTNAKNSCLITGGGR